MRPCPLIISIAMAENSETDERHLDEGKFCGHLTTQRANQRTICLQLVVRDISSLVEVDRHDPIAKPRIWAYMNRVKECEFGGCLV
jgi:hypothetical protein